MEPLVLFGAGLVVYCGYLAVMDEVADLKRCLAKNGVKRRQKDAVKGKRATRNIMGSGAGKGYNCGRLQTSQVH
jgi:hypothetical protein